MRIVIVQVFAIVSLTGMALAFDSKAQELLDKKISLEIENKSMVHVLNRLEKVTDVKFIYSPEVIQGARKVSIHASNEFLINVLDHLLTPLNLTYEVVGKQVVVRKISPTGSLSSASYEITALPVKGKVTDDKGQGIPGVNVLLKGTNTGASTDADGTYSLNVPDGTGILVFSFIGYVTEEVPVNDRTIIDMVLLPDIHSLSEVVVTAFGIEKEQKRVGYSVTQIKGDEVQTTREPAFMNALTGKVAGVVIQSPNFGPGSSSRVIIRGNSTFGNNRQPLYVVDGVPIDNTYRSTSGSDGINGGLDYGGTDPGDGLSNLNPDDVESISVLKGVSAGALYGNRAQNGVILITTKKGKKNQGLGITFNTNTVVESLVPYSEKDLQYTYGRGEGNQLFGDIGGGSYQNGESWGPKFGSVATFLDFDGTTRPYVAQTVKENFKRLFSTGVSTTNSLAFAGGSDKSTYRLSLSQSYNKSPMPNVDYKRYNVAFRGTSDLGTKIHTDYKIDLSRTDKGQPLLGGDDRGGYGHVFSRLSNTTDITTLDEKDANGNYLYKYKNPYVQSEKMRISDHRDRIISALNLKYDITSYLHASVQAGVDISNANYQQVEYHNNVADADKQGIFETRTQKIEEDNIMGMLNFNKDFSNFSVNVTAGAAARYYHFTGTNLRGYNFITPNLLDFSNMSNKEIQPSTAQQKKVNSLFGSAQFGYKDYLFLEVTARQDWNSALAKASGGTFKDGLFYPSANISYVFTDQLRDNLPVFLSSGKVRASVGTVGSDQDPGKSDFAFAIQNSVNGLPTATINNSSIPPVLLRPEKTTEIEFGTQLGFLNNRLNVDFAWYRKKTVDFLLNSSVSNANGFGSIFVNGGSMQNTGIELLISGTPVKAKDFSWDISLNMAHNKNVVLSLIDQLKQTGVNWLGPVSSNVGDPFASIYGTPFRVGPHGEAVYKSVATSTGTVVVRERGQVTYDANGQPLKDENGTVIVNNKVYLGSGNPTVTGGLTNTFRYKGVSLGFLIDGSFGGSIYSNTNRWANFFGLTTQSIQGREGEYIPQGIINTSGDDNNPVYASNTLPFSPFQQYNGSGSLQYAADQQNVYKNSFIKLRQISLGYSLPAGFLSKTRMKSVTLSLVARNLFYFRKTAPIIDPNSSDSIGAGFGYENGALPASRTYGVNLNVQF